MEAGQTRFHPKWVKWGRLGRGEIRGDRGEHGLDPYPEGGDRGDTHDGDQADEHAVLDQSRALLVLGKTFNEITHGNKILFRVGV